MPWSKPWRPGEPPSADEVIRRLAYHIHHRVSDPMLEEKVRIQAGVCRKTLRRYSAYQKDVLRIDANNGPRRLDVYYRICLALGENPGLVLWAATASSDYGGMLALMASEVEVRHRVTVIDIGGEAREAWASVLVRPHGSARDGQDEPCCPAA